MKYKIRTTNQFNKDLKRCQKRNLPMEKLRKVISMLADDGSLPAEYKPHKLVGTKGDNTWECHIQPDWLLIWQQFDSASCCLSIGCIARYASSFCAAICSKTDSKSQEINL